MKRFYHGLAFMPIASIICALASCGQSSTEKAQSLLDDARIAMQNQQYDEARMLIDSLRENYPKEFDVRRKAIAFSDSVELLQAREDLLKADSLFTFKELELSDAKSAFVLEKNEKYQTQGYYVLPKHAGNKQKFSFFPEVEETGKMLLVSIDAKRKYTFDEVNVKEQSLDECIQSRNLSTEQKEDVAKCYNLAVAYSDYATSKELKEKLDVKVRFFEKKLSQ